MRIVANLGCLSVPNREGRVPDPQVDEIVSGFWSFQAASDGRPLKVSCPSGILMVQNKELNQSRLRGISVEYATTELDLINTVVDLVVELDPDIICGWEVQSASWGYLNERGQHYGVFFKSFIANSNSLRIGLDISELMSRAPPRFRGSGGGVDQWGARQAATFAICGRHVLNVWRVMRTELSLSMYSFENVAYHVLKQR